MRGVFTNANEFAAALAESERELAREYKLFVNKIALELFRGVVMMSPVADPDTWKHPVKGYIGGRFRSSWTLALTKPDDSVSPEGQESYPTPDMAAAVATLMARDAYQVIWVSNNLPYAQRLEEGWSRRQAPHGMMKVTLARLEEAYG